jgi:uncharacterized protein
LAVTISLYEATIPTYLQILGSVDHLIDKARAHAAEHGIAEDELVQARLADDMQPLAYQIKASAEHSRGAIEALRAGVFTPSTALPPQDFDALRAVIAHAREFLGALDPAEVNGFTGRDMRFEFRGSIIPFTGEGFLLSFAQPNFYFHATTAYDVLRNQGVKIGKRDFLGALRIKA